MPTDSSSWIPLTEATSLGSEQIGNKAARLAELSQAGFSVLAGWVLPVSAVHEAELARLADELRALDPTVKRWILRSSSPLEDRPGSSAAGLFHSEATDAQQLEPALARVLRSRHAAILADLLQCDLPAPLAILAQPFLSLSAWATAELRPPRPVLLDATDPQDPELRALLHRLESLSTQGPQLVELGLDHRRWWLFQMRPAPNDALPDELAGRWTRDREHSPRPLCPLLASIFENWIAERETSTSLLVHGVWYDFVREAVAPLDAEAERLLASSLATLREQLEAAARQLQQDANNLDGNAASWRAFVRRWLQFQHDYYERPTTELRSWLSGRAVAARGRIAQERERALDALARHEPSADEFEAFLAAHGHHAAWPWDGRGRTWSEEPQALRKELRKRGAASTSSPRAGDGSLAGRIAAHLEDDDDALVRAYGAFRTGLRRVALLLGVAEEHWEQLLELSEEEFASFLEHPADDGWMEAARAGRRRWTRWQQRTVAVAHDESITGIPIHGGSVSGRPRVLQAATEAGGPDAGEILVVPSIQPADAIVFARIAGLIVEGGDRLGHAAVLAREAGLPCIIGATAACDRLRAARHIRLLADSGSVLILDDDAESLQSG